MSTTLPIPNQPKYVYNKVLPSQLQAQTSPKKIDLVLKSRGCKGCELGCQPNFYAPVVYRGTQNANKMIIGEAPGFYEDKQGSPFTGPAGQLMDKIFATQGWNTNADWYVGNVIKCRPVAPPGLGKQNITPGVKHRKACKPYILQEIKYINPHTVVLLGATAAKSIINAKGTMNELAGKVFSHQMFPGIGFFIMYHPAALLHSQKDPERYGALRKKMWDHIQQLRKIVDERE